MSEEWWCGDFKANNHRNLHWLTVKYYLDCKTYSQRDITFPAKQYPAIMISIISLVIFTFHKPTDRLTSYSSSSPLAGNQMEHFRCFLWTLKQEQNLLLFYWGCSNQCRCMVADCHQQDCLVHCTLGFGSGPQRCSQSLHCWCWGYLQVERRQLGLLQSQPPRQSKGVECKTCLMDTP